MNEFVESLKRELSHQNIIRCQCNAIAVNDINTEYISLTLNLTDPTNIALTLCGYQPSLSNSGYVCQLQFNESVIKNHFENDVTLHVEDARKMIFYGRQFAFAIKNVIDIVSVPQLEDSCCGSIRLKYMVGSDILTGILRVSIVCVLVFMLHLI